MKTVKSATPGRVKPTPLKQRRALRLTVQYATRAQKVPRESQFAQWVRAAMRSDAEITVRLVGEREGRELNRAYRSRDYATNVLTFVMNDSAPYEGDLALCVPVVAREAREQGKALVAHYAHLTVHGVLHLQGYEHENDNDALAMERLEKRILKRLGYPDPYSAPPKNGRHTQ